MPGMYSMANIVGDLALTSEGRQVMYTMPHVYGKEVADLTGAGTAGTAADRVSALAARQQGIVTSLKALDADVNRLLGTAGGDGVNAVIELSPKDVPLTTLLVFEYLRRRGLVVATSHCHSSLKRGLPEELRRSVETKHPYSATARPGASRLFFVWKEGPAALVTSPLTHAPIVGDSSIARFLCRTHQLPIYEGAGGSDAASLALAAEVDRFLDVAKSLQRGTDKERAKHYKTINGLLHKQPFLAAGTAAPSLADFAVWAALESAGVRKTACKMGDIARWDGDMRKQPELAFLVANEEDEGATEAAAAVASGGASGAAGAGGSEQTKACVVM